MPYVVNFTDVGRGKAKFTACVQEIEHSELLGAVRASKLLASRLITFQVDPDSNRGLVLAGDAARLVGRFSYRLQQTPDAIS